MVGQQRSKYLASLGQLSGPWVQITIALPPAEKASSSKYHVSRCANKTKSIETRGLDLHDNTLMPSKLTLGLHQR